MQVHTPEKTAVYENLVKLEYERQCGGRAFAEKVMLRMDVKAYFEIPKSTSKKAREAMLIGAIRPTKKPDVDNLIKTIADACNALAYHDDSQIVQATVEKYYSDNPRVEVTIVDI